IEMKNFGDKLLEMVTRGDKDTDKYRKLCAELEEKREVKKEKFFQRTIECLATILPEAESRGIKLGVENRQSLDELPVETDYPFLFRERDRPNLVYWHDTGHAQIKENLGFIHHAMHLESLQDRLAGFHIHDVQFPGKDHCAPGTGMIDFAALKPWVKREQLKGFEFSPRVSLHQVLTRAA